MALSDALSALGGMAPGLAQTASPVAAPGGAAPASAADWFAAQGAPSVAAPSPGTDPTQGALAPGSDPSQPGAQSPLDALAASPGYQFQLQQGQQGLERAAAARGTLLTGGTAKALDRYNQDYASTAYANRVAQLQNLSGLGAAAAGQQATLGTGYATQAGNLLNNQATNMTGLITGQGNAQAAGTIGQANAWAQGIGGAGSATTNALQMYYLSNLLGRTPTVAPGAAG